MKSTASLSRSITLTLILAALFSLGAAAHAQKGARASARSVSKAAGLVEEAIKLADNQKYVEAIQAYKLAIQVDPNYARAHGGLGDAYLNRGDWPQALAEYKEQVRLAPNEAQAHFDLGYLYNVMGRHGEAFAPLVKATALDPTFAEAFYEIGYAYLRGADFEKSIPFFRSALKLNPNYDDAYYGLGVVYARLGKGDLANEQLKKLRGLDPKLALKLEKEIPVALEDLEAGRITPEPAKQAVENVPQPSEAQPATSVLKTHPRVTRQTASQAVEPGKSSPIGPSGLEPRTLSDNASRQSEDVRNSQKASSETTTLSAPASESPVSPVRAQGDRNIPKNRTRSGTLSSPVPKQPTSEGDWSDIVRQTMPGVVSILMYNANGKQFGSGSGFLIASDGIVVTNYHVIQKVSAAQVITKQGEKFEISGVIAFDRTKDFAIVKIPGFDLPIVPLGNSNDLDVGEPVSAIGDSLGLLTGTVSTGIISAKGRELFGSTWVQTSAPVSHGNSGGPLLNRRGEAIGVIQGGVSFHGDEGQNLNLAVPINYIRGALQSGTSIRFSLPQLVQEEEKIENAEEERATAAKAEAERRNFGQYDDPDGIFSLRVLKLFRVQHARRILENGLTVDETIFAPESATLAELGGYLSEGTRIVVIVPASGGSFTPEAIETFKAKAPEFALTGNPGFEVSNTGMAVINGLQAKVYTMNGKGLKLPEPERNVSYVFGSQKALVEIDVVVPESDQKILDGLTQLAKTFTFNSGFLSSAGAAPVALPTNSSQPTNAVTLRDVELSFRSNLIEDTIRNATRFLQTTPNSALAHAYLGLSLLVKKDVDNGVLHLEQAVLLGEPVTLPVKRLREPLLGHGLDEATVTITRDSVIVRSGKSIFQADFSALSESRLANYNNTCPIAFLKGQFLEASSNKGKTSERGFNLFPPSAGLRPVQQGQLVYNVAVCNDEGIVTTAVVKLLYRLMADPR